MLYIRYGLGNLSFVSYVIWNVLELFRYHGPDSIHTAMRWATQERYLWGNNWAISTNFNWFIIYMKQRGCYWSLSSHSLSYFHALFLHCRILIFLYDVVHYIVFFFLFIISYHLLARAKACIGDYRSALQSEKLAFNVYQRKVRKLREVFHFI